MRSLIVLLLGISCLFVGCSSYRLELASDSVQPSAACVLEMAAEVGAVVRGRVGVMGDRDDLLAASPHRSGVPCVGRCLHHFLFEVHPLWEGRA